MKHWLSIKWLPSSWFWVRNHIAISWTSNPVNIRNVQRRRYFPVTDQYACYKTFTVQSKKVEYRADWWQSTRGEQSKKMDLDFSSPISAYLTRLQEQQKAVRKQISHYSVGKKQQYASPEFKEKQEATTHWNSRNAHINLCGQRKEYKVCFN